MPKMRWVIIECELHCSWSRSVFSAWLWSSTTSHITTNSFLKSSTHFVVTMIFLGLPVQHRLAGEAYIFCCWAFFLFAGTHRWETARQATAVTAPTVGPPPLLIKYPQTFDPSCPFLHGAKWPKFRPQSSSNRSIFELGTLSQNKNKLVKDRW